MANGTKNSISLIGNVGKDPDVHTFPSGDLRASFSLATKDSWKGEDGQRQERTQWHNCVVFGNAAKVVKDYVGKGDKLAVDGAMEYRDYTDKEGVKRNIAEVVVRQYRGEVTLLEPKR